MLIDYYIIHSVVVELVVVGITRYCISLDVVLSLVNSISFISIYVYYHYLIGCTQHNHYQILYLELMHRSLTRDTESGLDLWCPMQSYIQIVSQ